MYAANSNHFTGMKRKTAKRRRTTRSIRKHANKYGFCPKEIEQVIREEKQHGG